MSNGPGTDAVILVVEDEALVRMNGVDILEDAGYSVLEAASAGEALAILEKAPQIKLLFNDVDMPGVMDGFELAELVHSQWPKIRLLLTSGHHEISEADLPDRGKFVPKPYSGSAIISEVKSLLGN